MNDRIPSKGDESSRIPRWLTIAAIITVVLALLIVAVLVAGGGHTPMRHG